MVIFSSNNSGHLAPVTFNYSIVAPVLPNPWPVLAAVTPATVEAGSGGLTITLEGANFASGISTAYWNGAPMPTTYVSPTQLTAVIPAVQAPGTVTVTVVNQPPVGWVSAPLSVTVTAPAAQLAVTPSKAAISWGQAVTLDVDVDGPGANRTVTLQRMQANETQWSAIATLTTDASGHASFDYRPRPRLRRTSPTFPNSPGRRSTRCSAPAVTVRTGGARSPKICWRTWRPPLRT